MRHAALILSIAAEQCSPIVCTHEVRLRVNPDLRTYALTITWEYGGPNGERDIVTRVLVDDELAVDDPAAVVRDAVTQMMLQLESKLFAGAAG